MELRMFEDFITLAETRSFSRASIKRNTTQSAFSRRIQNVEAWVGATLIDRSGNPIKLTPAGKAFYELAQDTVRSVKHGCEEVVAISSQTLSVVSFAVTHSLSLSFFPRWIGAIETSSGPLSLRLLSHDGETCRAAVMNGECHFMIVHFQKRMEEDFRTSRLKSLILGMDKMIPVAAPTCRRLPLVSVPGTIQAPTPYLSYTRGSFMGRSLDLFLRDVKEPVYLQPCFESSLAEGVKGMVVAGHGLGWLPESMVRSELDSGSLVRAGGPDWDVPIEVRLFRPITRLPKIAEELWGLIRKELPVVAGVF